MKKLLIFVLSTIMMAGYSGRNSTNTDDNAVTTRIEVTQTEETSVETEVTLDTTTESTDINTLQSDTTTNPPVITVTTKTTDKPAVTKTPTTTKVPSETTCPVTTNKPAVTSKQTIPGTKTPTNTTTTAAVTSNPSQGSSSYVQEVVNLVNAERAKAGLSALTILPEAERAAQVRATEIITSFSHTRPNGSSPFTALDEQGVKYKTCGENIAAGQRTPQDVMNSWMNSSGHRANILNASFKQIGVGYANGGSYGTNWVQMFVG